MKELIIYLAKSLVDQPDAVTVTEEENDDAIVYTLSVAEDDMGRVIGKHGKIAKAIRISRKCLGIVYQNIVFAIAVKLLALVLVALGAANMWLAIFADVGVMVLAVLNAIRAMFVKNL